VKWGGTDLKWGGRAPLALPLATALRFQLLFLSDADRSSKLIPQSEESNRAIPPKFSKTCSIVISVQYIRWVRHCLIIKIKS